MERTIFNEEHEMFRDAARTFLQNEIKPHRDRWAEAGCVDREAYEKMGEQGMLLMWADEKYGGAGVKDFRYEQILMEELTLHGEVGFFLWLHSRLVAVSIWAVKDSWEGYPSVRNTLVGLLGVLIIFAVGVDFVASSVSSTRVLAIIEESGESESG